MRNRQIAPDRLFRSAVRRRFDRAKLISEAPPGLTDLSQPR